MIYTYIQKELKGYAISLTKNIHDAEDLIQDTCLKMFIKYPDKPFSEQMKLAGFVMKNLFVDWFRKHKFIEELPEVPAKDEVYERIQQKELQVALMEMKNKKHAFSFRLRIDGYSNTEIAEITNDDRNNINQHIVKTKKHLQSHLNQIKCHSYPTTYKTKSPESSLQRMMALRSSMTANQKRKQQRFITQLLRGRHT